VTERVEIDVAADEVDWVSGLLWSVGVDAVEERDGDVAGRTTLVTAPDTPALREALGDRWTVRVLPVDDSVLDTWRAWAVPVRCGPLVVLPAWVAGDAASDEGTATADVASGRGADHRSRAAGEVDDAVDADGDGGVVRDGGPDEPGQRQRPSGEDVTVRIDPGRAFGHGAHPTTRAVLGQVVARVAPGSTVLDVGCGSGVLAVAAVALGADRALAIDLDDEAVRATVANAAANGVADRVTASTTPLDQVGGAYELVVANIGAATLIELASPLAARVAPAGALVLSGLLHDRRDELLAAYPGFAVDAEVVEDGWCTVALVRR
jgi:ribosomal protein L11 methylase PrmA